MREDTEETPNNTTRRPPVSAPGPKFRYETDKSGHKHMIHDGLNRHDRRAKEAFSKKQFKTVLKKLRGELSKHTTSSDSEKVGPTVPQAPDTVPSDPNSPES